MANWVAMAVLAAEAPDDPVKAVSTWDRLREPELPPPRSVISWLAIAVAGLVWGC